MLTLTGPGNLWKQSGCVWVQKPSNAELSNFAIFLVWWRACAWPTILACCAVETPNAFVKEDFVSVHSSGLVELLL